MKNELKQKMKKFISFSIAVGFSVCGFSQITFQKVLNDGAGVLSHQKITATNDGGIISVGRTYAYGQGNADIVATKWNNKGGVEWIKTIGGANLDDAFDVEQDLDDNYVIGGETQSYGEGSSDMYILKLDTNGNILWTKTYGTSGNDEIKGVEITNNNEYLFVGQSASHQNFCVLKTDENGAVLWFKNYDILSYTGGGQGAVVKELSNGDLCITGLHRDNASSIWDQAIIIRTNSNGTVKWTKKFVTGIPSGGGSADDFVEDENGNLYVITQLTSGGFSGVGDMSISKLDSAGNEIWRKIFGTTENEGIGKLTYKNGILYGFGSGTYSGNKDATVLKINGAGDLVSSKRIGAAGKDVFYSFTDMSNGFVGVGYSQSFGANFNTYLVRMDSSLTTNCNELTYAFSDSLITGTGQSFTTIAFDTTLSESTGGTLIDITTNLQDSTLCYQYLGCTDTAAENYNPDATVDDGTCVIDGTGRTPELGTEIKIFPNPTNGELRIDLKDFKYKVNDVKMYDQKGVEVYSRSMTDSPNKPLLLKLDNANFRAGTYVVLISTEKGSVKRNIVLK